MINAKCVWRRTTTFFISQFRLGATSRCRTESLLADQGLMCVGGFLASLALRPVCHSLRQQLRSWIAMEVRAAGLSLATGTSVALIISRFTLAKPEPMGLLEACAKTSVLLFLWCNLYFSISASNHCRSVRRTEKSCCGPNQKSLIKTKGSVLPVLPCGPGPESKWCLDDVTWISAAGDYVELHTRNATHLLRETMNLWARSLTQLALPVFISACNLRILSDTGQRKTPIAFACESGERVGDSRRNHRNRRFRNRTSGISLLANPSSPAGTRSFPHDCPDSVPSYLG